MLLLQKENDDKSSQIKLLNLKMLNLKEELENIDSKVVFYYLQCLELKIKASKNLRK